MKNQCSTNREKFFRATAVVVTAALLFSALWVFLNKSGAWLTDKGKWSESAYMMGHIEYKVRLNNKDVEYDQNIINYSADVPLIGGVKLNDSSTVAPGTEHYQQYAEENFNEGVTVLHVEIINNSDFAIGMNVELSFSGLFDDEDNPKDVFYLVLPQHSEVDTGNYTVTVPGGTPVTYKNYVKSCLANYGTYEQMRASLSDFYSLESNSDLCAFTRTVLKNVNGEDEDPSAGSAIVFDLLVWSEYDELPFVEGGELVEESDDPAGISGSVQLSMSISQQASS